MSYAHSVEVWEDMAFTPEQREHFFAVGLTNAIVVRDLISIYIKRSNDEIREFAGE